MLKGIRCHSLPNEQNDKLIQWSSYVQAFYNLGLFYRFFCLAGDSTLNHLTDIHSYLAPSLATTFYDSFSEQERKFTSLAYKNFLWSRGGTELD